MGGGGGAVPVIVVVGVACRGARYLQPFSVRGPGARASHGVEDAIDVAALCNPESFVLRRCAPRRLLN